MSSTRKNFLVLCLGVFVSAWVLAPSLNRRLPVGEDFVCYLDMVSSAKAALLEGQFPIREYSQTLLVRPPIYFRLPVFQFVSELPYLLAGALALTGLPAYGGLLLALLLYTLMGFFGAYVCGRCLGFARSASALGASLYLLCPALLFSWYSNYSWTQACALDLLPLVLAGLLCCGKAPSLLSVCASALAWIALILTHSLFHFWGGFLFFFFLLAYKAQHKDFSLWACAAAYALAVLCCAWMLVPLAWFGRAIDFAVAGFNPFDSRHSTTLAMLLDWRGHPVLDPFDNSLQGRQVGLPIVAGLVAALVLAARGRGRQLGALLAIFFLAFYFTWTPFNLNFWPYLGPLAQLQFTQRLVPFLALFGSLAAAGAWNHLPSRTSFLLLPLAVLLVGVYHLPYEEPHLSSYDFREQEVFFKNYGFSYTSQFYIFMHRPVPAFLKAAGPEISLNPQQKHYQLAKGLEAVADSAPRLLAFESGRWTKLNVAVQGPATILLPTPWYPRMHRMLVNGQAVEAERVENRLAYACPKAGAYEIDYRFAGLGWANRLSLLFLGLLAVLLAWGLRREWGGCP